jgi:hypothetical protein
VTGKWGTPGRRPAVDAPIGAGGMTAADAMEELAPLVGGLGAPATGVQDPRPALAAAVALLRVVGISTDALTRQATRAAFALGRDREVDHRVVADAARLLNRATAAVVLSVSATEGADARLRLLGSGGAR